MTQPTVEKENIVVTTTGSGGFETDIDAGGHRLRADEPASVGGADAGPTPYGLLLAALGACTGMTLRMYAERKKIELDEVIVRLSHRKIHASDCEACESETGRIDVIEREIELLGNLTEAQRQRLLEIADKCPVHKTLRSEVVVRTSER